MHISLVFLIISLATPILCNPGDIQLKLTHVDYGRQLSKLELVKRAAGRSQARAALLSYNSDPLSTANIPFLPSGELEYVIELSIGNPPRPLPILLDTGSGLIWTQCKPCSKCVHQPSPFFDPSKSSTFSLLPCSNKLCQGLDLKNCTRNHCTYQYSYADQTFSSGNFATDTFTLGTRNVLKVPIAFGCGNLNGGDLNNSSGIAGFSRAASSLVSQLGVSGFSYCMTDDINKISALKFGTQEEIFGDITAPVQTTKFIQTSLPGYETLYFVAMTGITVGSKRLRIPKSAFSQGMVVDSGTAFSQIPDVAFYKLEKALLSNLKLTLSNTSINGLDCFASPSIPPSQLKVPKVILHFPGMDLDLPRENYVDHFDKKGLLCLTMMPMDSFGILGNTQQVNMQVMYDLNNNRLAIAPNQCYKE